MEERLQKVLARAGFGSRRECEELVIAGHVRVNGRVAAIGRKVDPSTDRIEVRGVPVSVDVNTVYLALNKPVGVVTTARDPQGRPTVLDFVPPEPRIFPVGRLDIDTSGLLLLTNDGELAERATHPRYEIPKVYVAEVAAHPNKGHVQALRRGVDLDDGRAAARSVRIVASGPKRGVIEIEVAEGRNRLVRRMLDAIGLPVRSLTRVAIGPVKLGRLKPGTYRALRRDDVIELMRAAGAGDATGIVD